MRASVARGARERTPRHETGAGTSIRPAQPQIAVDPQCDATIIAALNERGDCVLALVQVTEKWIFPLSSLSAAKGDRRLR